MDAIELDVQLTTDGRLAVIHDWDLERLAGSPAVIEASSWDELRSSRLLTSDGTPSRARIPRLEEVFEAIPAAMPVNIELKRRKADPVAFLDAVCPVLEGRDHCWVSSFDWELLRRLHRRQPELQLAPLASRRRRGFEQIAERLRAVALHCALRVLSDALLRRAHAAGRPVLVYTVDDPAQARSLFERGVSGIFTNEARRLRRGFRRS